MFDDWAKAMFWEKDICKSKDFVKNNPRLLTFTFICWQYYWFSSAIHPETSQNQRFLCGGGEKVERHKDHVQTKRQQMIDLLCNGEMNARELSQDIDQLTKKTVILPGQKLLVTSGLNQ